MQEYSNTEQQLLSEGQIITVLHGKSMWPMIRYRKDPVLIRPLHQQREGTAMPHDVVAYRRADKYVVHRVLRVCADHYVIRGDNCLTEEHIPHEDVFGIVTHWWRNGKEHTTHDIGYRTYVTLWLALHPLYRFLRRIALRYHLF